MKWFRLYGEMIDDPKIGTLNDQEFRTWIELLCLACKAGRNGDTGMTIDETSWYLRRNVSETFQALLLRNIVTLKETEKGRETIHICKWKERQYQSDTSTDRVRKYREKQKKAKGNVSETLQERPTDTDTDTDTEIKERGKKGKAGAKRATGTPKTFSLTLPLRKWADEICFSGDLDDETSRFLDYHRSRGSTFKDWTAAWRNWIRKAKEFSDEKKQPRSTSGQKLSPRQQYMNDLEDAIEAVEEIENGNLTTGNGSVGNAQAVEALPGVGT